MAVEAKEQDYGFIESQTFGSEPPYQNAPSHGHGQHHQHTHAPSFNSHQEPPTTRRFIFSGLLRWFITALLCGMYYLIVKVYEGRTLSPNAKSVFDWLTIGVTLILGLNMASSYKEIGLHMKPWFYAKSGVNIRDIELHSLMELARLMWRTPNIKTKLFCATWVLLNVIVQAGIAAVSLTYSADPEIDAIFLAPGNDITIPDMSKFTQAGKLDIDDLSLQQYFAAHILGDIGSSYNYTALPSESLVGIPVAQYPSSFWNATDHWEYIYLDSAPSPGPSDFNFLSVYSNRSITTSAICINPVFSTSTNLSRPGLVTIHQNDTGKLVDIPTAAILGEAITYLSRPIGPVFTFKNITTDCGPGCSTVQVVEVAGGNPRQGTYFNPGAGFFYYECNVTVLPADPTDNYTVSSIHAAIAAQAIGLSGNTDDAFFRQGIDTEYVTYSFGLPFGERQNNDPARMADQLARFAIGVIAAMAQTNPKLTVTGNQPRQGVRLAITLPAAFGVILLLAAFVQLILMTIAVVLVHRLVSRETERS